MSPEYEARVKDRYEQIWQEYKHIIIGELLMDSSGGGPTNVFDWQDSCGFRGSDTDPVNAYLESQVVVDVSSEYD